MSKVVSGPGKIRSKFFLTETGPGPRPNFFSRTANNTFTKNGNFYGRVRLLLSVMLSQLMCYKYSSKKLQKSLSRDSQSGFGTGIGMKIFLLTRTGMEPGLHFFDRDRGGTEKGWCRSCFDSKRSLKEFIRVIILKYQNETKVGKGKRSVCIMRHQDL
jgi:hypothetical protein